MNLTHIHAFTAAMQRKDLDAMLIHMSDDVRLLTPLVSEPFQGKASIRPVVEALLAVVDSFEFLELMEGPQHVSEFFKVTVEMTVLWRPLPAIVAVQNQLNTANSRLAS
jgi:hypothetical protein